MTDPSAVVRRFNEAINERDLDALAASMSDTHRFVDAAGATTEGKPACVDAWRGFFEAAPDYRNVFEDMTHSGDGVVVVHGYSESSIPELDGPAEWRAVVRDGRVDVWQVSEPDRAVPPGPKWTLHRYLKVAREALLWKLEGLSEYDIRRPMTPTGTNLLGLVKHVASVAAGYFGETFDRPFPEPMPWFADDAEANADMWASADESRDDIVGLYRRAWAHADATIAALPLDAIGRVSHWGDHGTVTLHLILVHMVAEADRHAGHADIARELVDGAVGHRPGTDNMADGDAAWWAAYRARLEAVARHAGGAAN